MVKGQILYKNGDIYLGQLKQSILQGQGLYTFKNGSYYQGEFKNNKFEGKGKLVDKQNDITIVGQFVNGNANGYARVLYSDGGQYEGIMVAGVREGKGVYKSGGVVYQGEFKGDQYCGNGQLVDKVNKIKYSGQFLGNMFHGNGQLTTLEFLYIGEFYKGQIQGKGTMKYNNNQYYDGQFQLNKKHGFGKYTYQSGTQYSGQWQNDQKHGKGRLKYPNSTDTYTTQFQNDIISAPINGTLSGYTVIAETHNNMFDGTVKMKKQKIEIEEEYRNGVKNGRVFIQKVNQKGEKIGYRGQFSNGREVGYKTSYSKRF